MIFIYIYVHLFFYLRIIYVYIYIFIYVCKILLYIYMCVYCICINQISGIVFVDGSLSNAVRKDVFANWFASRKARNEFKFINGHQKIQIVKQLDPLLLSMSIPSNVNLIQGNCFEKIPKFFPVVSPGAGVGDLKTEAKQVLPKIGGSCFKDFCPCLWSN